ncbi:hypothetical protein MMC29_000484 [Sticta canariensis]|nr:hypothetical protein [Sticta canariensis]
MSATCKNTARCCARVILCNSLRPTSLAPCATSQRQRRRPTQRWASTESAMNPKITVIVDQISQLTLLETADLVSSLKSRLNIPDMPMGGFAAPVPAAPAPIEEEEEAAPAPQKKTLFTLTLKSFEPASKPKIIKEIKSMLGLSLVDSKKFVESAPKQMREGVSKEESEKIIEALKGLGGVVTMD